MTEQDLRRWPGRPARRRGAAFLVMLSFLLLAACEQDREEMPEPLFHSMSRRSLDSVAMLRAFEGGDDEALWALIADSGDGALPRYRPGSVRRGRDSGLRLLIFACEAHPHEREHWRAYFFDAQGRPLYWGSFSAEPTLLRGPTGVAR